MSVRINRHAANCTTVTVGTLTLYFSYDTCVGFAPAGEDAVFADNRWGRTTEKHLNWFGSKKEDRLETVSFDHALAAAFAHHKLS